MMNKVDMLIGHLQEARVIMEKVKDRVENLNEMRKV